MPIKELPYYAASEPSLASGRWAVKERTTGMVLYYSDTKAGAVAAARQFSEQRALSSDELAAELAKVAPVTHTARD